MENKGMGAEKLSGCLLNLSNYTTLYSIIPGDPLADSQIHLILWP